MVDTPFPEIVDSVPDLVDIFLKKLPLAITIITITVYFLRYVVQEKKRKRQEFLPFWVYLQRCSFVQLIPNGAVDKIIDRSARVGHKGSYTRMQFR